MWVAGATLVGDLTQTVDASLHVASHAVGNIAAIFQMPAGTVTEPTWDVRKGGGDVTNRTGWYDDTAAYTSFALFTRDTGNDVAGAEIAIGRNSNATNANSGTLKFTDVGGTARYLGVDATGPLRVNTSPPAGGVADTAGTVVGGGLTPATTGVRYLCISTTGVIASQAAACSGT